MPTAEKPYWQDAQAVYLRVKAGFRYTADGDEHWELPPDLADIEDDCDGFAIACRSLLRELGHDARLVFCRTESGGFHLLCSVGRYGLDNRSRGVSSLKTLRARGYEFISCSGTSPGEPWREMKWS